MAFPNSHTLLLFEHKSVYFAAIYCFVISKMRWYTPNTTSSNLNGTVALVLLVPVSFIYAILSTHVTVIY